MAIPGLRPTHEVVAKVRIGEKKKSSGGKEYPSSTDYFICDDPHYTAQVGAKAKSIRVFLPYAQADANFATGLEWWRGKQLTCYSKGVQRGAHTEAYRIESMVELATVISPEKKGKERSIIACPVRDCAHLKAKECKPMGRLQFWIDGIDRSLGVFQLDTKSWNSIEKIEAVLSLHPDPRGIPFLLTVEMVQKGRDKFPVVTLEAEVEVNTPEDVALADAIVQLAKAVTAGEGERQALAVYLDAANPGWRDRQDFIDRIKELGAEESARRVIEKVADR